jgi:ribosomal protein S5
MKGGRIAKAILKQFGIADCTAKAVGRRKPFGVVRAIFKALARHDSLSNIARSRGRRIIEMEWRRGAHS